ncbi:MAG: metallopeptidase family protein [Phycisphaerales bacterium]
MDEREAELVSNSVAAAINRLPEYLLRLIEEVPVVLLDEPTDQMLIDLGIDHADPDAKREICGLHTGVPITEESIESPTELPSVIHLFRRGLAELARTGEGNIDRETLDNEVRITLLHELGHQFGLDEDDLESLGYG